MTQRSIIVGIRGGEGRTRTEARALQVYASHRSTYCNEGLMSQAEHGHKSGSSHVGLRFKLDSKSKCYTRGKKVSMLQLAHPKIAQPFRPQVYHGALTIGHGRQTVRCIIQSHFKSNYVKENNTLEINEKHLF